MTEKNECEMNVIMEKKVGFFNEIIQKTILHVQRNKMLGVLGTGELGICMERIVELNKKIAFITGSTDTETMIQQLQTINNDLSGLLKNFGTESLDDVLSVCFGNSVKNVFVEGEKIKYDVLKTFFHPIGYKAVVKRQETKSKKPFSEECVDDKTKNLECTDVYTLYKSFYMKVHGMKVYIYNTTVKKGLILFGIVDDIIVESLNNSYIRKKIQDIRSSKPIGLELDTDSFEKFLSSLQLKDLLIHSTCNEFYNKYAGYMSQNTMLRQKPIPQIVKTFLSDDLFSKRNTLLYLLIKSENYENLYLAYLLYDLLSNDTNGTIDTEEQTMLYDSFPWQMKQMFKKAMKKTVEYTNELSNFDVNKIPLEQQICLLKVPDSVKEKAMIKLKEVKVKSEDSGSKARQYLDGLLKIPFMTFKREPILYLMDSVKKQFKEITTKYSLGEWIPQKEKYSSIEILSCIKKVEGTDDTDELEMLNQMKLGIETSDKKKRNAILSLINATLLKHKLKTYKITYRNVEPLEIVVQYEKMVASCYKNTEFVKELVSSFYKENTKSSGLQAEVQHIRGQIKVIQDYMGNVKQTLNHAVHGHEKAKKQIESIICQWINGEQDGYCFGFEGPPGVGKTSLAKRGLSDCLKDEKGKSRPFSLIAMGGDSNGSTLHGHNYTYVGSTWGSIVQILIDKKCMNPIIFIDEVDKISRTEQGREIVGILTHLLDPTQNDCFQDKYFSGIDFDLSKALFILSYNDPDSIDKILLDRVHRIQFSNLTLEDKIIISKTHILPEIYKKMGLEDVLTFSDKTLTFIIEEYTLEAGVRKLKEKLFEIVGEINLTVLQGDFCIDELPYEITIDDIKNKYFKDKREIVVRKVPAFSEIGYVNGMYATSLGNGGTLPIHAKFFPSETFLELKLTGLQQEVMRESMNVSLTVAWNLTSEVERKRLREMFDIQGNKCGINIHTGDGAVSKDGPSGGCAVTIAIYSLLNNIPVKPCFGVTGEIQMSGEVTAIGGLSNKILGSLKASVTQFLFPKENQKDFDEFYEKYNKEGKLDGIQFFPIQHISEALNLIMEKNESE